MKFSTFYIAGFYSAEDYVVLIRQQKCKSEDCQLSSEVECDSVTESFRN